MRVVCACTFLLMHVRMYTQILTPSAVLVRTCERQSYTFRAKNAPESQGGHSEVVGIEERQQNSLP